MLPFLFAPLNAAGTVAVQTRVEERPIVTSDRNNAGNDTSRLESEVAPQARYDLIAKNGADHAVALYAPRLVLPQTEAPSKQPLVTLHSIVAGLEQERTRYHLAAYMFGAYGIITTSALLVQAPWKGDGLPARPNPIIAPQDTARFKLLFLQPQASIAYRLTRRLTLTPTLQYNAFGGANSVSRGTIAMVHGPGGTLALEALTTRSDSWKTTVGAGYSEVLFEGDRKGAPIVQAQADERYRHAFTRAVASEVAAGAQVGGDAQNGYNLFPTGEVNTVLRRPVPMGIAAVAVVGRVAPWINLFSGDIEQRGEVIGATSWTVRRVTLRAQASAGRVVFMPDTVSRYSIVQAEAGVAYAFSRYVSGDVGARTAVQAFSNAYRESNVSQHMAFVGLTIAPQALRL